MTAFRYTDASPVGILSQAAAYIFESVMPELHWQHDPDHAQAMLFVLRVHGHLGVRVSMVERDAVVLYRLTGVENEGCDREDAAGLVVELRPDNSGGTASVVAGTDAQVVWLMMMVDVALDFVAYRHVWPPGIGVNWRARNTGGETQTWPDWFMVGEVTA